VDVLLRAIRLRPELHLTLDVFGIAQGDTGERYLRGLRLIAENDARIQFKPPEVPSHPRHSSRLSLSHSTGHPSTPISGRMTWRS
jgi:hypothetical protein